MSRRPVDFVKERKKRIVRLNKYKIYKERDFHNILIPLTGKEWVISQIMPEEQF